MKVGLRWVFEHDGREKCLGYASVNDGEVRSGNLHGKFNAIVIPDQTRAAILNGHRAGTMPPEYTGGLGSRRRERLCASLSSKAARSSVSIALRILRSSNSSCRCATLLTVCRARTSMCRDRSCALNSTLQIQSPQACRRNRSPGPRDSPVFEIVRTASGSDRADPANVHVIAWYPKDKDPLLSGWLLGGDRIKGKAALVEVTMGKGRIILFGFRPQYRGQSLATYPLLLQCDQCEIGLRRREHGRSSPWY